MKSSECPALDSIPEKGGICRFFYQALVRASEPRCHPQVTYRIVSPVGCFSPPHRSNKIRQTGIAIFKLKLTENIIKSQFSHFLGAIKTFHSFAKKRLIQTAIGLLSNHYTKLIPRVGSDARSFESSIFSSIPAKYRASFFLSSKS